jgi:uncharacterized protein YbcI
MAPGERTLESALRDSLVGALKDLTGRGPELVRAFVHGDVVGMVAERTLTDVEVVLDRSKPAWAAENRRSRQRAVRAWVSPDVEDLTGRRVVASLSDHAADPDVAAYVFLLDGRLDETG